MTIWIAWLVFPLVLGALSLGCGLLAERVARVEIPSPLLLPLGFAVQIAAAEFAIIGGRAAPLATPLVVALAVAGAGLSLPWTRRLGGWWLAPVVAVFAVFAAPFVLSGLATFGGYIKLDDTATYLAMLDRAMQHGYDTSRLAPSTYEATLSTSLAYGYPLGSLLPLGVGRELVAQDAAWLWQPYLAFMAALLAGGLYQLASGLVVSRKLRALVAFGGAQAALIYGYSLWGGVKELATAVLVVLAAALVPIVLANDRDIRRPLPLAVGLAALLAVLSLGGAVWIAVPVAVLLGVLWRTRGTRSAVRTALVLGVSTVVLSIPTLWIADRWLGRSGAFTSGDELGNLLHRLSWLQVFGIWPSGDFRVSPHELTVTRVLVVLVAAGAVLAVVTAFRRHALEVPVAVGTAALACAVYVGFGSPWIGGKALASASPIVLTVAFAGAAVLFEGGRRVEAIAAGVVLLGAVLWSNALQYRDVDLAPAARLADLATIGQRFAGQGPTLLGEYEPYGARHFLRGMATEAASELRRRPVYLRTGGTAATGSSPDLDELKLSSILPYRTLVLRRSGAASRPPSVYVPVWTGRYYQVWQRPAYTGSILAHLPLGSRVQPAAVPPCSRVLALARLAAADHGELAAVERSPAVVIAATGRLGLPSSFGAYGESPDVLYLTNPYSFTTTFDAPAAARYGVWVGGSFKAGVAVDVDGRRVGGARDSLNWPDTFTSLGSVQLTPGRHTLGFNYSGAGLRPGSGGTPPFGTGPIVLSPATQDGAITYVQPADARTLCGKTLDWVEALRG
ncbi:MAG TPA: hypothetical protein VLV46_07445 [Gaiellaceae bacterium]|nr:hypothetical protein [Gaiellaceae bacterium]